MRRTLLVSFIFLGSVSAFADFSYSDFSSVAGLQLNGTAHQVGNVVRLTDDQVNGQAGNMWVANTQSVGNGFSSTFSFRCDGAGNTPADGIAFGIQNVDASQLGIGGGDNGMGGLSGSLVINFQSFWNTISISATDDSGNNVYWNSIAFNGLHRADPWLAQIQYDAQTKDWTISLDNSVVLTGNCDLSSSFNLLGGTDAYVGLGAGTGLGYDNNDALSFDMQTVPEPCTLTALGVAGLAFIRRKKKA